MKYLPLIKAKSLVIRAKYASVHAELEASGPSTSVNLAIRLCELDKAELKELEQMRKQCWRYFYPSLRTRILSWLSRKHQDLSEAKSARELRSFLGKQASHETRLVDSCITGNVSVMTDSCFTETGYVG